MYDWKKAYKEGDVVMRNGSRLRAVVDIPAETPYDAAMWKFEPLPIPEGGDVVLKSPDGREWSLGVTNDGELYANERESEGEEL